MSREGLKKQGYLFKFPVKGLVKKWTKRWFMLYGTTHEGVVRLEYYDNPESMVTGVSTKRTIPLRECTEVRSTIGSKVHPYAFEFTSQLGHHIFASETLPEVDSWIDNIKDAIQEDKIKRRRSKAQSRVATSSGSDISESTEKGTSYKNKVDSGTYRVTLQENETSRRMNLTGTYNLELGPSKISLAATAGVTIFSLSYKFLKNYGKQSGQFHFETGKNSPIGEGKLILVTTCSKEIFGVVHSNIKRLKEQGQRKLSGGQAPANPSQAGVQLRVKKPPPPKATTSGRTSTSDRPSSRHSTEVGSESMPGKYRSSKNMEEEMASNSAAKQSEDVSALYAVVDKSRKTSNKKQDDAAQPSGPQDSRKSASELPQNVQLAPPHNVRDSRMSTMLVELDDNAFDDSFDEDEGDDAEYDDNLEPLAEGVTNPFDDDGNLTEETHQDIPEASSADQPDWNIGSFDNSIEPPKVSSDDVHPPSLPATSNQGGSPAVMTPLSPESTAAPTDDALIQISEPAKENKMKTVLEGLDFGFGPGKIEPVEVKAAPEMTASTSNSEAPQTMNTNFVGNVDFNMGLGNPQEAQAADASTLPDLNFDFGDFPPIPGLGNDPFSSPLTDPPPLTGNIAELDFGTLDNNFFDNLEAMNIKDQQSTATGAGAAAFDTNFDDWGDSNTTL